MRKGDELLEAVSIVGIFIFLTVSYYLMTSKVTAKARVGSALSVLSKQNAGLCQQLNIIQPLKCFTWKHVSYAARRAAEASVLFTTTCAFGMLVSLLQSVGIIGMMTVEWPVDLKGFFSYFQVKGLVDFSEHFWLKTEMHG